MFSAPSTRGYKKALPGILMKTLVFGKRTLLTEFRMEKGSVLPLHSHRHEQTGYLAKGRIKLTIGKTSKTIRPGGSWCIPGGVMHGATIHADAVAVEVFSPVRKEYIPEK
jgi:quercetin dioxygenase-like cupin family protein